MLRLAGRIAQLTVLLASMAAHADTVADWAYTTTEIATDAPNTTRTLALAQSAVYEAVNAITSRYPRERVDLGPTDGASIDGAIAAASRSVLIHEAPSLKPQTETAYQKTLAAIPDNAAVLDSMGWALHRMNKSGEALPYLEKALEHGRDPDIALHLGDVQWSLNRQSDARVTWENALKDFPDNAELKGRLEKRKGK